MIVPLVPMLLVRFAGPWIVVATWAAWRPVVGLIALTVRQIGRLASLVAFGFLSTTPLGAQTAKGDSAWVRGDSCRNLRLHERAFTGTKSHLRGDEGRCERRRATGRLQDLGLWWPSPATADLGDKRSGASGLQRSPGPGVAGSDDECRQPEHGRNENRP